MFGAEDEQFESQNDTTVFSNSVDDVDGNDRVGEGDGCMVRSILFDISNFNDVIVFIYDINI